MVDFSNISKQAVSADTTKEYFFDTLVGEPSVITAPADDSNVAYLNERLRLATERAAKLAEAPRPPRVKGQRRAALSPEQIKKQMDEDREYDRQLLASTCIKGWGVNPPEDADGNEVPFSAENCLDFLRALPDYALDPFRNFTQNIFNFIERPTSDPKADEELGEFAPTS